MSKENNKIAREAERRIEWIIRHGETTAELHDKVQAIILDAINKAQGGGECYAPSTADLVDSWCREFGVKESISAKDQDIKYAVGRLWDEVASRLYKTQGADTKRLDWLEKTATLLPQQRGAPATKRINFVFWEPEQSIREAIDRAMNQPADAGEKGGDATCPQP